MLLEGTSTEGLEGTLDSDVVAGAVGSVINCKGWIRTLLLEGTLLLIVPIDAVVVDCRMDVVNWKVRR